MNTDEIECNNTKTYKEYSCYLEVKMFLFTVSGCSQKTFWQTKIENASRLKAFK